MSPRSILNRLDRKAGLVHLQGIGKVKGMPAGEIQPGDVESRNYAFRCYVVTEIVRETEKTIFYKVRDPKTGEVHDVKRRKDSLAPVERTREASRAGGILGASDAKAATDGEHGR